jgi:hypothetical protein
MPLMPSCPRLRWQTWWPATRHGLLGRGDGFTPLGDDVVCGWLVTRRALGEQTHARLALQRTTDVSATLLSRACEGEAIAQLGDLLVMLDGRAGAARVDARLERLLAVGATSGAGLAIGAADRTSAPGGKTMSDRTHVEVRPGAYADSVTLLQVSKQVSAARGVQTRRSRWRPH